MTGIVRPLVVRQPRVRSRPHSFHTCDSSPQMWSDCHVQRNGYHAPNGKAGESFSPQCLVARQQERATQSRR
jgi:hypothetical protein